MSKPLISVLVCTKERQQLLLRCLQSLQQLNFDSFEVIVVDNGSKDFQLPALEFDFPIRYFAQSVQGISYARNYTISYCQGDFVALIDDDAIAHPDWLTSAISQFQDPSVGCVTGKILPLQINNEWQQRYFADGWFPAWDEVKYFERNNYDPFDTPAGAGTNIIARKKVLTECKFPEFLGAGTAVGAEDDHYLFYRIISMGWKIVYNPDSIVYHPCPETEAQYSSQILKSTTSRTAYLFRFLLSEKGYRLHSLRHILSKIFRPQTRRVSVDVRIRTGGFLKGAIALGRSLLSAQKNRRLAVKSVTEITRQPFGKADVSRAKP